MLVYLLTISAILIRKSRSQRKYLKFLHKGLTRFCLCVEYSPVGYTYNIVDTVCTEVVWA